MKTYKDLDKSIVMNAPEGAMWWCDVNNNYYGLLNNQVYYFYTACPGCGWSLSDNFKSVSSLQAGRNLGFVECKPIPLPNIETPWEATENSVCPVAEGTHIIAKEACGYTHQIKANSNNLYWNTKPITGNQIVSYKIIDEEYLPLKEDGHLKEQEDDPAIESLVKHLKACPTQTEVQQQQLIKHLEFLQILTNKFPEIKDKVVELMEVELDAWWHSTFEENNDD